MIIALKSIVEILKVSCDVDIEVSTVVFDPENLLDRFINVLICPNILLVYVVQGLDSAEQFCGVLHILLLACIQEKCKEAAVEVAHLAVVFERDG